MRSKQSQSPCPTQGGTALTTGQSTITPTMTKEFVDVLSFVMSRQLRNQGLTHSVSTGKLLPSVDLRLDMALDIGLCDLFWRISGCPESHSYDHPECGREILVTEFPETMASLERLLDKALLAQTHGDPVARRLTTSERLARPQLDERAAVLLCGNKRAVLTWSPWEPGDPFALSGPVAREAKEMVQAMAEGRVTMLQAFGGTPLFLVETPRQRKRKSRAKRRGCRK